jgi:cbb3-type cytochrome oxidase subunit 3
MLKRLLPELAYSSTMLVELLLFFTFFLALCWVVLRKGTKAYSEIEKLPLTKD